MSDNNAVAKIDTGDVAGFGSKASFDLLVRQSQLISSSTLVPEQFSIFDKKGKLKGQDEQKYALSNAVIAMEMASRIGASPLMVCQNLYIVHGRPGWSSQFIIAAINASKKFSPLRFEITEEEAEREVPCVVTEWVSGNKTTKTVKEKIKNKTCIAWALEKDTGERLESPPVSLEMAVMEGWMSKDGSKWKTMPDLMLRYRTATLFGRLYAPELLMGIKAQEELQDIIDITPDAPVVKANSATDILNRFSKSETNTNVATDTGEVAMSEEEKAEIIPPVEPTDLLQSIYALIATYGEKIGETPDDAIDALTNHKIGTLIDLEGKAPAYLNDIRLMVENAIASEA